MARAASLNRVGVQMHPAIDDPKRTSAIAAIATYIPTEVVGTYLACLSACTLFTDKSTVANAQWLIFLGFVPVTGIVLYAGAKLKDRRDRAEATKRSVTLAAMRFPKWPLMLGLVSFVVWAAGVPTASPLTHFGWSQVLGTLAILIWALVLGSLAPLVTPDEP
jgi:hypothetical protein